MSQYEQICHKLDLWARGELMLSDEEVSRLRDIKQEYEAKWMAWEEA